jgi:hypothetical protein
VDDEEKTVPWTAEEKEAGRYFACKLRSFLDSKPLRELDGMNKDACIALCKKQTVTKDERLMLRNHTDAVDAYLKGEARSYVQYRVEKLLYDRWQEKYGQEQKEEEASEGGSEEEVRVRKQAKFN